MKYQVNMKILLILLLPAICFGQVRVTREASTKLWWVEINASNIVIKDGKILVAATDTAAINAIRFNPNPLPAQRPFKTAFAIPGKIEAEDYDLGGKGLAWDDTTPGNQGGAYRQDDVDIEGINLSHLATGDWTEYTINVTTAGRFTILGRTASLNANGRADISIDGVKVGQLAAPNTNSWTTYTNTASFTTANSITAGAHVVRIAIVVGNFNIDYLTFSVPTAPPTGNIINVGPGQNLEQIIESQTSGTIVVAAANTSFNIQNLVVPIGVSVEGNNTTLVATLGGDPLSENDRQRGMVEIKSGGRVNGNQYFKGFNFDGKNLATTGLRLDSRDNVHISDITAKDFRFCAMWITNATAGSVKNVVTSNTSWASSAWASGEINFTNLKDYVFENCKPTSTATTRGYGFKALYGGGTLDNTKFIRCETDLNHQSGWGGGVSRNLGLEIHNTNVKNGLEIRDGIWRNQMSLAYHTPGDGSWTDVHHNIFTLGGDTYTTEAVLNRFRFRYNQIFEAAELSANFQRNGMWRDHEIENNVFKNPAGQNPSWMGIILVGPDGVSNVRLRNNEIQKGSLVPVRYMSTQGGVDIDATNRIY